MSKVKIGSSLYRVGVTIKYLGDWRHAGSFAIRVSRRQVLNLTPFLRLLRFARNDTLFTLFLDSLNNWKYQS